jgi:hypothetical protein
VAEHRDPTLIGGQLSLETVGIVMNFREPTNPSCVDHFDDGGLQPLRPGVIGHGLALAPQDREQQRQQVGQRAFSFV